MQWNLFDYNVHSCKTDTHIYTYDPSPAPLTNKNLFLFVKRISQKHFHRRQNGILTTLSRVVPQKTRPPDGFVFNVKTDINTHTQMYRQIYRLTQVSQASTLHLGLVLLNLMPSSHSRSVLEQRKRWGGVTRKNTNKICTLFCICKHYFHFDAIHNKY